MSEVVNLNQFRKKKAKSQADEKARNNRARFGRTKDQKQSEKIKADRENKTLDGKEISKSDGEDTAPGQE